MALCRGQARTGAGYVAVVAHRAATVGGWAIRQADLRHNGAMRVLVVGAGGVGAAFAAIAQRRAAFTQVVLADVSPERAREVVARLGEPDRFMAERVDASDRERSWSR